ncbi:MAG: protein kinase [Clostridia bacterium]|nr:protein kinase [Clostridia bacterium]
MFCEKCGAVMKDGSLFCPKCGAKQGTVAVIKTKAPVETVDTAEIDAQNALVHEIWPDWTITEKLGEGSFGKVYRAKREDIGSTVYSAIKIIKVPQSQSEADSVRSETGLDEESTTAYFKSFVDDCVNEIKTMESLKGTQNIVSVEDYKVLEDESGFGWTIIIRMELLTGFVEHTKNKTLSEKEVIKLGIDMCNALEFCSKLNIMHRDIKPENIFVSNFGIYKLGDFGIARKLEKSTAGMSKKGTYNYMAPEIYNGSTSYDYTSDIYSLGIVLYKLLNNNRFPLVDARGNNVTHQQMQDAFEKRQSGAALPKPLYASDALSAVILTACAFDPKKRFSSASAMKMALTNVQNGTADRVQAPPVSSTPKPAVINAGGTVGVIDKRPAPAAPQAPAYPAAPQAPAYPAAPQAPAYPAAPQAPAYNAAKQPPVVNRFDTAQVKAQKPPKKPNEFIEKLRKNKKKIIILSVAAALAITLISLTIAYFTSSEQRIIRALNKADYNQALSIYQEDFDGDASGTLVRTLKGRLKKTKENFYSGKTEYEVAKMEVATIEKMGISELSDTIKSVKSAITALNNSRTAFNTAESLFEKGEYAEAITNYKKVIEDDSNYESAKTKLATAIEKYRDAELAAAAKYVEEGSYTLAISELENALTIVPDDVKLSEQISVYKSENSAKIKAEGVKAAADSAAKGDFASAISAIETAIDANQDDAELKALREDYINKFVSAMIAKADALTGKRDFPSAIAALEDALKVLPDNEALKKKLEDVKAKQPVSLATLTPINGGWEWNDGDPTDPFQKTYTDTSNYKIFYSGNSPYSVEYRLYGKYKLLTGSVVPHADIAENGNCQFKIYADGKLVYTSPVIRRKTDLFKFTANISGADYIKIELEIHDNYYSWSSHNAVILMDMMLWTE